MESIQELTAEFLVAHANMREAVEKTRTPERCDYSIEASNVITDFDHLLRMMTSQALRLTQRANEFNKNRENK